MYNARFFHLANVFAFILGSIASRLVICMGIRLNKMDKELEHKAEKKESYCGNGKIKYMKEAMRQAKKAEQLNEVPIGCVLVYEDRIIARGYNRRNVDKNTLSHAELNAIRKASKKLGDWRLDDCEMYITLEPCQMCAGAIVQSRIKKIYIACMNPKAGCAGSILNLLDIRQFNHQVEIDRGLMEEECSDMLKDFFKRLRRKKDEGKRALNQESLNL